jgi:twitching motility protein PilT
MDLIGILEAGLRMRASDVHLTAGCPPLARVDGEIRDIPDFPALSRADCKSLVYSMLYEEQRARFEEALELDTSLVVGAAGRFRVSVLSQRGGVEAVLRAIPGTIPTPEAIGLGPIAAGVADFENGLVLVTGPAGSGKSTTLACLMQQINLKHRRHIIAIEDPIEFNFPRGMSVIRQREVGQDTHTFADALRHALRQDPNVLVVGEMRDLETIGLALTAAETGHLCLATLHTSGSTQTVDRIVDVFPAAQQAQVRVQLAGCLRAVLSQVLLARRDGAGRVAARELMLGTPATLSCIRAGNTHLLANIIETAGEEGMYSLERTLSELVRRGIVGAARARALSRAPERLPAAAGGARRT